jgi:hypothetical protein
MARATSSLPTPVSPVTMTGALEAAIKSMLDCNERIAGPLPISSMLGIVADEKEERRSLSGSTCRRRSSMAPATIVRSSSRLNGFARYWNALDSVDRIVNSAQSGDDDDGQCWVGELHPVEQLEPAHAIHLHVADDRVDAEPLDNPKGGRCVAGELALMSLAREEQPERVAHLRVVVHDEDARMQPGCCGSHGHIA